jgi:hypothetical protein
MKPTRMSRWIKRFARDASAVVLPEPKKPPAKISFTGFLTESVLLGLILYLLFREAFIEKIQAFDWDRGTRASARAFIPGVPL